jgi:hypothetical protein
MLKFNLLTADMGTGGRHKHLYRAKVPGGWLLYFSETGGDVDAVGLCFFPDPTHSWDGSSLD